jgi:hypothetical protein
MLLKTGGSSLSSSAGVVGTAATVGSLAVEQADNDMPARTRQRVNDNLPIPLIHLYEEQLRVLHGKMNGS